MTTLSAWMLGSIPPAPARNPTTPPLASMAPAGIVGNVKPNGGVSDVPKENIGGVGSPTRKFGVMSPGGFWRTRLASPSGIQSWYSPITPRMFHLPAFEGSQAKPTRGLQLLLRRPL